MSELAWSHERRQWTGRYAALLRDRIRWAILYASEHSRQPDRLIDHFESFLHLISQARERIEIQPLATELIDALHPWPASWGHGDRWINELQFAAEEAGHHGHPERQAKLLGDLAALLLNTGRVTEAIAMSEHALRLARDHTALLPWAVAGATRLAAAREQGHTAEAAQLLGELDAAWPALAQFATAAEQVQAWAHLGFQRVELFKIDSRMDEARDECLRLIAALESSAPIEVELLAEAYSSLGIVLYQRLEHTRALTAIQRAIELRIQSGDAAREATERGNLGVIYVGMADLDRAEAALRQLIDLTDQMNLRLSQARATGMLALVYQMKGQSQRAWQYVEQYVTRCTELGNARELARAQSNRADVLVSLGRYADAVQDVEAGITLLEAQGREAVLASALLTWSYCLEHLGQADRAQAIAQRALDIGGRLQRPNVELIALRHLARYLPHDQQIETLQRALALARQLERPLDAAGCLVVLAGLASTEDERRERWGEGVRLLERCGAIDWLNNRSPEDPPFVTTVL